ncbi:hypothetical protein BSKO_03782 [Bryopsis sp. KO-2023]|nr:hypothetical protein BSKO_03782 [Bryopsis sp. KO-2023]
MQEGFISWCKENGVVWNGIEGKLIGDGERGIVATTDLAADTVILKVPGRLLLTNRSAERDSRLKATLEGKDLDRDGRLAIHLLHELSKGVESFWNEYLNLLPREYHTLMHFSDGEIDALQFSHGRELALEAVEINRKKWLKCRHVVKELDLHPKYRSRMAWLWAASTIASRTMFLPFDEAGALTPFGDFLNYEPPPAPLPPIGTIPSSGDSNLSGSGQYIADRDEYHLATLRSYNAGDQVFMCYGCYTNLQLLEHYGFLLEENPHDAVPIQPEKLGLDGLHPIDCFAMHNGSPSWEALKHLRLASCTGKEKGLRYLASAGEPISDSCESRGLVKWRAACRIVLEGSGSSVEEDMEALGCLGNDHTRLCLAIRWRILQKMILRRGMNFGL